MSKMQGFLRKVVPTVLTIIGSGATIAAVILAAKEGPIYKKALEEKEMTTKEKIKTGVKIFAPAGACALVSVGCTVGAHCLDLHTQASIVGMYTLAQGQIKKHRGEFDKYRKKIEEKFGFEEEKKVAVEVAKDSLPEELKQLPSEQKITVHLSSLTDDWEEFTFETKMDDVLWAILQTNKLIATLGEITLNHVLELFGVDGVGEKGEEYGWCYDQLVSWSCESWLDFDILKLDDGSILVYPMWQAVSGFQDPFNFS